MIWCYFGKTVAWIMLVVGPWWFFSCSVSEWNTSDAVASDGQRWNKSFPPPRVTAKACSAFHAVVQWEGELSPGMSYCVERSERDDKNFVPIVRLGGKVKIYYDFGLHPGTKYFYRIYGSKGDCKKRVTDYSHEASFITPSSILPEIRVEDLHPGVSWDGITIFNIEDLDDWTEFAVLVAVDMEGNVIWMAGGGNRRYVFDFNFLPGNRILVLNSLTPELINYCGDLIARYRIGVFHHDVDVTPWGTAMGLMSYPYKTIDGEVYNCDAIVEFSLSSGRIVFSLPEDVFIYPEDKCPICLYFKVKGAKTLDWTHSNAIVFSQDYKSIYVSVRNLNRIYCISYPDGMVRWVMGDGGDFGAGLFAHQHEPEIIGEGEMLVFDNGYHRDDGSSYSRVVKIKFDKSGKSARLLWHYRERPDFFTIIGGDANQLPDGTILITDSMNGRIIEVDASGQILWKLQLPPPYAIYKSVRVRNFPVVKPFHE